MYILSTLTSSQWLHKWIVCIKLNRAHTHIYYSWIWINEQKKKKKIRSSNILSRISDTHNQNKQTVNGWSAYGSITQLRKKQLIHTKVHISILRFEFHLFEYCSSCVHPLLSFIYAFHSKYTKGNYRITRTRLRSLFMRSNCYPILWFWTTFNSKINYLILFKWKLVLNNLFFPEKHPF